VVEMVSSETHKDKARVAAAKQAAFGEDIDLGVITHTGHILDYVNARTGYVMCDGVIGCEGDPHEILATIREKGYQECIKCFLRRTPSG